MLHTLVRALISALSAGRLQVDPQIGSFDQLWQTGGKASESEIFTFSFIFHISGGFCGCGDP